MHLLAHLDDDASHRAMCLALSIAWWVSLRVKALSINCDDRSVPLLQRAKDNGLRTCQHDLALQERDAASVESFFFFFAARVSH